MTGRLLGLSCGQARGSAEILLKEALHAAEAAGAEVEMVRLDDLQNRARAACLDFGGTVSPESLRMLCCDAAVVPIVLNGEGQPLDVGRITRTIPDGLRRATEVGEQARVLPREWKDWFSRAAVGPMRVPDFHMSSRSRAS